MNRKNIEIHSIVRPGRMFFILCIFLICLGSALPSMAGTLTYASGSKFTMYNGPYGVWVTPTGGGNLNPGSITWSSNGDIAAIPGGYTPNATPPSTSVFNIFTFFGAQTYHYTTGISAITSTGGVVTLNVSSMNVWWNGNFQIPMPMVMTTGTYVSGSPAVGTKKGSWNPATGWLDLWGQGVIPSAFPNFLGVYHVKGTYTGTIPPPPTSCIDNDSDGYGNPGDASCPNGSATDCNDGNNAVNPGATEACNGIDDDCVGGIPANEADADSDTYRICDGDCNDGNAAINPGASDTNCNGVDENCSGAADEGFVGTSTSCGVGICAAVGSTSCVAGSIVDSCTPGTPGVEGPAGNATCSDGLDNDCDGTTDECGLDTDGDGIPDSSDNCLDRKNADQADFDGDKMGDACDPDDDNDGVPDACDPLDTACINDCFPTRTLACPTDFEPLDPTSYPGALEICDGKDNDGNGQTDEGVKNACGTCEAVPAEVCDGVDNNCNGSTDENACFPRYSLSVDKGVSFFDMLTPTDFSALTEPGNDNALGGDHSLGPNPGEILFVNGKLAPVPGGTIDASAPPSPSLFKNFQFFGFQTYTWTDKESTLTFGPDNLVKWDTTAFGGTLNVWWNASITAPGNAKIPLPIIMTTGTLNSQSPIVGTVKGSYNPINGRIVMNGEGIITAAFPGFLGFWHIEGTLKADKDGDGYYSSATGGDDCDDDNPGVHPEAADTSLDGVDQDCDPNTNNQDSDLDGDGYYQVCLAGKDPIADKCGDCNDSKYDPNAKNIYPGAPEICDGFVNDCLAVGTPDQNYTKSTYYLDADGDGFGDANTPGDWCSDVAAQNNGYVVTSGDCNDNNRFINPGAKEVCDGGIDNNCNGLSDLNDGLPATTYYTDVDEDKYGDKNSPVDSCFSSAPEGTVADNSDCDDSNDLVNPGKPEVLDNGIDDNCDGLIDVLVTPLTPGRYVLDINPDLPNIRAGSTGQPSLKTFFAFDVSTKWRAKSKYIDAGFLNNGLPGNTAGLISFELLKDPVPVLHGAKNASGRLTTTAEQTMANIVIQGLPRSKDNQGNNVYPGDYKTGYSTSPGGNYIHYIESMKYGMYDSQESSLELFLGVFDPDTGQALNDSLADTEYAGKRIVFPYDPVGTESYKNFAPRTIPGGCEITDTPNYTINGKRVAYNGKIFLYGGNASFVMDADGNSLVQQDTNGDGTIDENDTLIDADEDGAIDSNDVPDDLDGNGVIDSDDMVDSWRLTLATAGNIPETVPGFACIAFVHQLQGLIFPSQNTPPTADAGENVNVKVGDTVTLDGSKSSDPEDGTVSEYAWDLVSWPVASKAVLLNRDSAKPSITVDVPGEYVASLVVKDKKGASSLNVATVKITVCNTLTEGENVECAEVTTDSDGDHIPDWEDACPNDPSLTCKDSDSDGVIDSEENAPNDPAMTLVTEGGCSIHVRVGAGLGGSGGGNKAALSHVETLGTEGISDLPPSSVLLSYDIDVSHPSLYKADGAEVAVTIDIPCGIKNPKIFKLVNGEVKTLKELGIPYLVDKDGSHTITVTLKDGGAGDQDGQVNGIISDPIGIGEETASGGGGGGGGGGCALSSGTSNSMDAALFLLPLFVLYGLRWARKRVR